MILIPIVLGVDPWPVRSDWLCRLRWRLGRRLDEGKLIQIANMLCVLQFHVDPGLQSLVAALKLLDLQRTHETLQLRPNLGALIDANLGALGLIVHQKSLRHDLHGDPQLVALLIGR